MDLNKKIENLGLTLKQYEDLLKDIDKKIDGELDIDWSELCDRYNIDFHPDTLRKASTSIFGGKFRSDYLKNQIYTSPDEFSKEKELDEKIRELKKERIKLQTANVERNRIDRAEARQEMFYEYIGSICNTLPLPHFSPLEKYDGDIEYLLTLSDIHYGAIFESVNNSYSPDIARDRFDILLGRVVDFVQNHKLSKIAVVGLGDDIQGVLRVSDLKINDSSIVKATVEISKLIASFLNELSAFCKVEYYHVPFANHTQLRNLGTKANELADEDLEYIIGHYIKSLLVMNDRVKVNLANEGCQYIEYDVGNHHIISCHGHTLKGYKNSLKNLSILKRDFYDYCIVGHYHGGDILTSHEGVTHDCEVIVAPSFVGSDPYADSISKGSKASCLILGFDTLYGHTETYKIILN